MSAPPAFLSWHVVAPATEGGRYDQRAPPDAISPEAALAASRRAPEHIRTHELFRLGGKQSDEVRVTDVGGGSVIVFLIMDWSVVTCLEVGMLNDADLREDCYAIARGESR
ncbi:hypothetical protein [Halomarina oriensis]|uniref:Uncharacterized protein n=1 Tax=Halomarina oriensis TaxID=671145 RepID=A0A6B0GT39_9EURY|nr:hypothetical protein [Halomarina oriensis]MWG36527.1 hypothetical protein [Halomarina oriensis]